MYRIIIIPISIPSITVAFTETPISVNMRQTSPITNEIPMNPSLRAQLDPSQLTDRSALTFQAVKQETYTFQTKGDTLGTYSEEKAPQDFSCSTIVHTPE